MSNIMEESEKLKQALTPLIRNVVNDETRSCLRTYKAKVVTTPNNGKMEVRLVGEKQEKTLLLPYSSALNDITQTQVNNGLMVWVLTTYNSWLNAIVWQKIDFSNNSLEKVFPVGSIYTNENPTSPASVLGFGQWEQIKGAFLFATDNSVSSNGSVALGNYPVDDTVRGSSTHSLTAAENGVHSHSIAAERNTSYMYFGGQTYQDGSTFSGIISAEFKRIDTADITFNRAVTGGSGSGQPHNNMPPYLSRYVWQRIA